MGPRMADSLRCGKPPFADHCEKETMGLHGFSTSMFVYPRVSTLTPTSTHWTRIWSSTQQTTGNHQVPKIQPDCSWASTKSCQFFQWHGKWKNDQTGMNMLEFDISLYYWFHGDWNFFFFFYAKHCRVVDTQGQEKHTDRRKLSRIYKIETT